ncbi:MAG: sulfatase-like hydrolase/transferase [Methanothrix sp.]|nr:sulfatase-like hydrolase/transferase [Methanothrix sp.]
MAMDSASIYSIKDRDLLSRSMRSYKLKASLAASFLLSLTLLFFGPANLYYTNIKEMPFLFSDILYYIIAIMLATGCVLSLILWRLKEYYHIKASALVFALGLLFWIQGNILVWNYGLLDGHVIVWKMYSLNGIIDSMVWISVLAAAFLCSSRLYRYIGILCSLLIIMQVAGLLAIAYPSMDETEWNEQPNSSDAGKMYEFSSNANIIIVILDTFQSDIFQSIINDDPEYRDMFEGFTYYRNNVGGYPTTYLSVMYILSGKLYDNSVPISQYINNTSVYNSLPSVLKKYGVRTDIKSNMGWINGRKEIYDTVDTDYHVTHEDNQEIASLYQLTFFRFAPQPLKPYFAFKSINMDKIEKTDEIPDMTVYYRFKNAIKVTTPRRVFKLFHLSSPHPGLHLDENLTYNESPTYESSAKASLKICHALLESLKKNGGYDDSLIFIIGDHGTGAGTNVTSGGIPLMLVKPFNSTGQLKISDAPVSLGDIPKTAAEELKIRNNFSGYSIFSIHENDSRSRTHFNYIWKHEYWANDYLPSLREYKISGFSWNVSSWTPTYRQYLPEGVKYVPPPLYAPGFIIHFGINGGEDQYLGYGWSGPENGFRWTDGQTAVFECSLPKPGVDLMLNMSFAPFLAGQTNSQRLSIWINDYKLRDLSLTCDMPILLIKIPRDCFNEKIQKIKFDLPDAISPGILGVSADSRKLGIAVRTLSIDPATRENL